MSVVGFNSGLSDQLQSIMDARLKAQQQAFENDLATKEEARKQADEQRKQEAHDADLADRQAARALVVGEKTSTDLGPGALITTPGQLQALQAGNQSVAQPTMPITPGISGVTQMPSASGVVTTPGAGAVSGISDDTTPVPDATAPPPPPPPALPPGPLGTLNTQTVAPTPTGPINVGTYAAQQELARRAHVKNLGDQMFGNGSPEAQMMANILTTEPEIKLSEAAGLVKTMKEPVDKHSPAWTEYQDYVASLPSGTKVLSFNDYQTMDANRKKPNVNIGGLSGLYNQTDPRAIAAAIRTGNLPPDLSQYGRVVQGAVASELTKPGDEGIPFNLSNAQRIWKAQLHLNNTMNGDRQVRLDNSIRSGLAMFDKVDDLADKWAGLGLGPLSRANLNLALQGAEGSPKQQIAAELTGQIAQLSSDISTVEQGGLTPTKDSRDVAQKSMESWWGNGTIHAMTAQGRQNMRIRQAARNSTTPLVIGNKPPDGSTEAPGGPTTPPPGAKVRSYNPATGKFE